LDVNFTGNGSIGEEEEKEMIGDALPKFVRDWLFKNALKFPNVVGFSLDELPRLRWGRPNQLLNATRQDKSVIRFYVQNKLPIDLLRYSKDVIPAWVKIRHHLKKYSFDTDVVEIGLPQAPMPIPYDDLGEKALASEVDKTVNFRPVELGVSVGNEAITAGSLGMLYLPTELQYKLLFHNAKLKQFIDDILAGSNAHVTTPNAGWSVEDVIASGKINMLQRGSYHGGEVPNDVAGKYLWHQQIHPVEIPSDCNIAGGVASSLNGLSKLLGRQSRFKVFAPLINSIDFGLYKPSVEHILKIADDSIDVGKPFTSHLYAGSEQSGILCKISEILKARPDIRPANNNWCDPQVGDRIKGCSFWCNYETPVQDINGVITVNYGDFMALMQNAVVVANDGTIKGGWSGSGWFKV